ncbi:putative quinol monooxygenase [Commensalibacter papalotli (ex Botero et al. 2024)]|uniref:Quinol monooxygenase YgiN (YgiN) (PDB:1R6Y) (PUBMED:15613473) n=1 Tax=Commensalibacter papalotli (ex Botero et al. 2024) TaxID=2972766 RepID=A0ABN8W928_9PROT|nr:putative quinol monooxygenase [Commensalibacter papalotli (ex Botero et al. 2024)]CAI3945120.1 Quinol monooxygenase YgiN (YgiN) (PDB:1R6Y) (PUBMED:15613473) [Commensalibacter papalotli (ex Botero et al. 2024)]CAI3945746.1 Quinol monooxygenase YgiN (YgiN) (PDB:1R6Y) (PUBMED:15613473) [Commensalibacter papalotli (ex Botero et al. 2024)]
MSQEFKLIATLDLKQDVWEKISAVVNECVALTRQEEGNQFYAAHFERGNQNRVVFIEHWANQEAFDLHMQTDHFLNLSKTVEPYLERPMQILFLTEIKE